MKFIWLLHGLSDLYSPAEQDKTRHKTQVIITSKLPERGQAVNKFSGVEDPAWFGTAMILNHL